MTRLPILVPKSNSHLDLNIAAGSAIAGLPRDDRDGMVIFYEGNINQACNLHDFETRLIIAVGRLQDNYPTIAKYWLSPEMLEKGFTVVGHFIGDVRGDWRTEITDKESLKAWVDTYKAKGVA